ncbi:hypothetical protein FGADI_12586, partial [Fusarium gaditjirri]
MIRGENTLQNIMTQLRSSIMIPDADTHPPQLDRNMLLPSPEIMQKCQPIIDRDNTLHSYQPLKLSNPSEPPADQACHSVNIVSSVLRDPVFVPDPSLIARAEITSCSLSTLVKCLTDCQPKSYREQFVSAFFATSELFCTPKEILTALIKCFDEAMHSRASTREKIHLGVCYALRVWLESNWNPTTDQRILISLKTFIRHRIHAALPMYSEFLQLLIRGLSKLPANNIKDPLLPTVEENNPCQHGSIVSTMMANHFFEGRHHHLRILDLCHKHLASQITSKQFSVFSSIQKRELLAERWMLNKNRDAPNVAAMMQLTNEISYWVKESILTDLNIKTRSLVIEKWILVAQHLFQLSNFDGLVAVTSGLD